MIQVYSFFLCKYVPLNNIKPYILFMFPKTISPKTKPQRFLKINYLRDNQTNQKLATTNYNIILTDICS